MPESKAERAAALREEARLIRERAEAEARALEEAAEILDGHPSGLPRRVDSGTNELMGSTQINAESTQARPGVPLSSKGPIAKVAKLLGVSMVELARRLGGVNVHSLRTWDQRGRMPEDVKAKLQGLVDAHEKAEKAKKRSAK